ncbi:MAG: helix-turn-helix transcriptional regulator [Pseudobacteriovorax sp.]|nr:helix-turn-helix transcriptional regulator [Pseudobacteriovorax sp.]
MTEAQADIWSKHIAKNVLTLRLARQWSQSQLAKSSSIPRSTISNIESGTSNPSIQVLAGLCQALDISLEELTSAPKNDCMLTKAASLKPKSKSSRVVQLLDLLPESILGLEFDRMTFKPGARFQGSPHLLGTREFMICLRGSVEVYIAGERYLVEEGDVLAFPGDQAHSYLADGTLGADCISVVSLSPAKILG